MEVRVHKDHTSANDVPHPGQGWTRFVCISDTHSHFPEIPLGDVLFHAGDMSSWGYPAQIQQVFDWLVELPHPIKMCVALNVPKGLCADLEVDSVIGGNHDVRGAKYIRDRDRLR
jgi:3',5'-cyclic AMP phosphodiesterase CpdA